MGENYREQGRETLVGQASEKATAGAVAFRFLISNLARYELLGQLLIIGEGQINPVRQFFLTFYI